MHKTKEDRQKEAAERQEARNARTDREQLVLLSRRRGRSSDEVDRLTRRMR